MHLKYRQTDELMTMTWENGDHFKLHLEAQLSHVVGSSAQKGNWKKFWLDHTGRVWPKKCQILGCGQRASVGAHVYIKYRSRSLHSNFILPTCQTCNRDSRQEYGQGWVSAKKDAVVVRVKPHPGTYESSSASDPSTGPRTFQLWQSIT